MNNCLCESCCDKDYCMFYQDYKNPDGIITEPITACGRYKKLHTVEVSYTKDEVITMLTELKTEIDIMSDSVVDGRTVTITSWNGMQKRICKLIQSKIDKLKENTDDN